MTRFANSVAVLVGVLLFSGCSAPPPPTPTPDASTAEAATSGPTVPSATPSPVASDAIASMPASCERLATVDAVSGADGSKWRVADSEPQSALLPGPVARQAAQGAVDRLECLWWPPVATEAYLAMNAYQLDATSRDRLISALRSTEEYVAMDSGIPGSAAFSYVQRGEEIMRNVVYVFTGDVWFAGVSVGPSMDLLSSLVTDAAQRSIQ